MQLFTLPTPSSEQTSILEEHTKNIIVNAVAGCGKTTTILHIARMFGQSALMLTYNSRLRKETKTKVDLCNISLDVHTFHSFAVKNLHNSCIDDRNLMRNINAPLADIKYGLIIIDEIQDMSYLYYQLVIKIINKCPNARIIVLGDQYQMIFKFKGADNRHLLFADKIFPGDWVSFSINTSFRMTREISKFVNYILGAKRINTIKNGPRPQYVLTMKASHYVCEKIKKLLLQYEPEDIFILTPSIKAQDSIDIANYLTTERIPIYAASDDSAALNDNILKGKIVFSSFHQVKGLERKVVIVLYFDASYYKYWNRDANNKVCCNELYVAITRAQEQLIVIHNAYNEPLNFIDLQELPIYTDIVGTSNISRLPVLTGVRIHKYKVSALTRFLSTELLLRAESYFRENIISEPEELIKVNTVVQDAFKKGLCEEVSDIVGVAIPAYYEMIKNGSSSIFDYCAINDFVTVNKECIYKIAHYTDMLKVANYYLAQQNSYMFRLSQINNYNWFTTHEWGVLIERIGAVLNDKDIKFEHVISGSIEHAGQKCEIDGRADIISDDSIWEVKCCDVLRMEYKLQCLIYAWLYYEKYNVKMRAFVFNVCTNEYIELLWEPEIIEKLIVMIIDDQNTHYKYATDEEFINARCYIKNN